MTFQKNQIYTVTIEDIGTEGEGIGKIEGFSLFVKDALPGDIAKVRLTKVKKNYAYARLEEVLVPSPDRVEPPCPLHRQCGGCQIQALSYEKQLAFKQAKVENSLVHIGGFDPEKVREIMEPAIGMDNPWHYRNKAQYPFGYSKDGKIITGFYAGRTHSIVANTDCLLGVPENKKILEIILKHMEQYHVTAYEEESGQGLVRHVLIRKGFFTGELMVCIVLNDKREISSADGNDGLGKERYPERQAPRGQSGKWIPEQNKLVDKLAMVPGMTSISVNFNDKRTNVIMGEETCVVWGREKIRDKMHLLQIDGDGFMKTDRSVTYSISPRSFYQVNTMQAEKLYSTALSYAELTGRETVWDLYCGIGTISLFLSQAAKQVYGVEAVPEAVEDARENARNNGISNAEFFVGKVEEILPGFYGSGEDKEAGAERDAGAGEDGEAVKDAGVGKDGEVEKDAGAGKDGGAEKDAGAEEDDRVKKGTDRSAEAMRHPDVIVADPPRKGCDEVCLRTILKMRPERVVYVSCDPATLARDLKVLCEGGYEMKKGRVVDQFCQGVHVETVVLLSQLRPDDYIDVKLDLEELDVTASEKEPTYQKIKEYILKEHGVKVHTAYIAQVKRKYGLDMRKNNRPSKNEEYVARQCPEEQERYIKEALEHFAMIG